MTRTTPNTDLTAAAAAQLGTDNADVLARFLSAAEADTANADPNTVSMEIIGRVLHADTADDVLAPDVVLKSEDYVGKPFTLFDVRFAPTKFEGEGPKFYALMSIADTNGEKQMMTSSAGRVIAQAFRLRELDAFPVNVQVVKAERPTAAGYFPLWLERAPSSF